VTQQTQQSAQLDEGLPAGAPDLVEHMTRLPGVLGHAGLDRRLNHDRTELLRDDVVQLPRNASALLLSGASPVLDTLLLQLFGVLAKSLRAASLAVDEASDD